VAPKFRTKNVDEIDSSCKHRKAAKKILYKKAAHKILVKLTSMINFENPIALGAKAKAFETLQKKCQSVALKMTFYLGPQYDTIVLIIVMVH